MLIITRRQYEGIIIDHTHRVSFTHQSDMAFSVIARNMNTKHTITECIPKDHTEDIHLVDKIYIGYKGNKSNAIRMGFNLPMGMQIEREDRYQTRIGGKIFVFGSNLLGIHGGGAAKTAYTTYDAEWGVGEGITGRAYALPTKDNNIKTLPLETVGNHIKAFIEHAEMNPTHEFFVTRVGCGLAGFKEEEISPFFKGCPDNCELPYMWGE